MIRLTDHGVGGTDSSPGAAEDPLDYEARARAILPAHVGAYYASGAGVGDTHLEGIADWSRVRFRPRVLTDVGSVEVSTSVLGTSVRTPVLIAPMAQQLGAHPDGEAAMGRAVVATGSLLGVSTHTAVPFSVIADTGAPWWLQVYVMRDRSLTERLVRRAVDQGARALLLTVDMIALLPAAVNPRLWPDDVAKTRWANLTAAEKAQAGEHSMETNPSIDFSTIGWLKASAACPCWSRECCGPMTRSGASMRGPRASWCPPTAAGGLVRRSAPHWRCRRWSPRSVGRPRSMSTAAYAHPSTSPRPWPWGPGQSSSAGRPCGHWRLMDLTGFSR